MPVSGELLTISGRPTAVGEYKYTATASYAGIATSVSTSGELFVWPKPTVTLPDKTSSMYQKVETGVQEWRAPIPISSLACNTLTISNLPSGLTVDTFPVVNGRIEVPVSVGATSDVRQLTAMRTVYINGTPAWLGEYTYEVKANNRATQRTATATGKICVKPTPVPEIVWADSTLTVQPLNPNFTAITTKPAFTLDEKTGRYTTTVTGTLYLKESDISLKYTIHLPTRFGINLSACANGGRQLGVGDPLMSDFSLNERTMTIKWEGTLAAAIQWNAHRARFGFSPDGLFRCCHGKGVHHLELLIFIEN